jgi:hypothetical protein
VTRGTRGTRPRQVAFRNNVWMYYIKKLNNDEYPKDRKHLSVKYGFKCTKQLLGVCAT